MNNFTGSLFVLLIVALFSCKSNVDKSNDINSSHNNLAISEEYTTFSSNNNNLTESEKHVKFSTSNNGSGVSKQHAKDSIPFRHLPLKEQLKKAERFHIYGDLKLKLIGPLNYVFRDYNKGLFIREDCPNILNYMHSTKKNTEHQKHRNGFKIEFYNDDKTLIKKINLEKETPYTRDKFKIVQIGAPDMEHYNFPSENFSHDGNIEHISYNEMRTDPNGFTVLQYQLISISGNVIIDWEETLAVYDRQGEFLGKLKIGHDVLGCWVSNDGKKLALIFGGGHSSNPKDFSNGVFRIYDIESSMQLYEQKTLKGEHFAMLNEIENGFLQLGIRSRKSHTVYTFFDLENNFKYTGEFTKNELREMVGCWTNYVDVLKKYPFEKENY